MSDCKDRGHRWEGHGRDTHCASCLEFADALEIKSLRAENEALRKERDVLAARCAAITETATKWAMEYVSHKPTCRGRFGDFMLCNCGLSLTLASLDLLPTTIPQRAKALLECVEKARVFAEAWKRRYETLDEYIELDKALKDLDTTNV